MHDLSKFLGGQCEILSHLSEQNNRQTCRGDIESIRMTGTELEIHFEWLASWSLEDGFWTMLKPSSEDLQPKITVDNPSKIRVTGPYHGGMLMVDISACNRLILLYPPDYKGAPSLLNKARVEEHQQKRAELDALLNAKASGSSHSDNV